MAAIVRIIEFILGVGPTNLRLGAAPYGTDWLFSDLAKQVVPEPWERSARLPL